MVRSIQKIGTSRGIILSRDMIDHLGLENTVDISFEDGRIVLTAPKVEIEPRRRNMSVENAVQKGIDKYRPALDVLAGKGSSNEGS